MDKVYIVINTKTGKRVNDNVYRQGSTALVVCDRLRKIARNNDMYCIQALDLI